jgi:hypothetical protein
MGANAARQASGAGEAFAGLPGQAASYGAQTANLAPNDIQLAKDVWGLAPMTTSLGEQVARGIAPLQAGAQQLMQTGYDPRQQLYQRGMQQNREQSNAANAMYGLGSSPYGAGLAQQNMRNFDIDWQNQQLARQATALQGAGGAYGQAGGLGAQAGNLFTGAGNLYQGAGNLYTGAGNLFGNAINQMGMAPQIAERNLALGGAASGLAASSAALPSGSLQGAQNLLPGLMQSAAQPYTTSVGQSQNALNALQQGTNQGIQQYQLPQNILNDLQSYLQLGQSASGVSGQLGQLGNQQQQQQLGNIGGLAGLGGNLLFGNQGLSGALGLGQSGLLGAGGFANLFGGGGLLGAGVGQGAIDAGAAAALDPLSGLADLALFGL